MVKESNLPDARAYAKEIAERIGVAKGRILAIFEEALHEASLIATLVDFDQERAFLFDDYPLTKKRADVLVHTLSRRMLSEVTSAVSYAWGRADAKNDALELAIRGSVTATRREKALAAFLARKEGGMDLSGRVWRTSMQAKSEMEMALDLGLRQGKDSAALSRDLRAYLREPERLFRRVRDAHGQLRLSQSAAAYHPGQGVYRSSYKSTSVCKRSTLSEECVCIYPRTTRSTASRFTASAMTSQETILKTLSLQGGILNADVTQRLY